MKCTRGRRQASPHLKLPVPGVIPRVHRVRRGKGVALGDDQLLTEINHDPRLRSVCKGKGKGLGTGSRKARGRGVHRASGMRQILSRFPKAPSPVQTPSEGPIRTNLRCCTSEGTPESPFSRQNPTALAEYWRVAPRCWMSSVQGLINDGAKEAPA